MGIACTQNHPETSDAIKHHWLKTNLFVFFSLSLPPPMSLFHFTTAPTPLSPSPHPYFLPSFLPPLLSLGPGPECSRNFTSNSGVIKSPGFPEKYPNNLDCTFMIFSPKMSEIYLEFESFELEPDTTPPTGVFCRYDRLEIWDGFPGGERGCQWCLYSEPRAS